MNAREALTQRIRFLNEHIERLRVKALAANSERASLIEQRQALTDDDTTKIDALQASGVVKVEG